MWRRAGREQLALAAILAALIVLPALLLGYQVLRSRAPGVQVVDLVGYAPATGGWQPDTIRVRLGERVRLRIAAADVVHGFTVPELGIDVKEILPGHVEEVDFVADRAGRFPFACTRWCSADHWRMRGTIEVVDPERRAGPAPIAVLPLYQRLKVDPDAERPPVHAPPTRPSAAQGGALNVALPADLLERDWIRTHSPTDAFARLRVVPGASALSDDEVWSLVAYAWQEATAPAVLDRGREVFARDCAACHGETGKGDGPAGRNLPGLSALQPGAKRGPANFTDATRMLSASDVMLHGKALRGGMGTGMPEWGSIHSDQDLWAVVSYLRSFVFEYSGSP